MAKRARQKQEHLPKKLLRIRRALGLSQIQLVKFMGIDETIAYHRISEYESGRRQPSLLVLLAYARVAGVHMEEIINDRVDLPKELPGKVKHP